MELKIFVTVLLASLGGSSFPEITTPAPQRDKIIDHLVEATTQILTSCYGDQIKAVGVYGDSNGTLLGTGLSNSIPVISIDPNTKVADNIIVLGKLEVFAILAGSSKELELSLRKIKHLPWWNHGASFLILNWPTDSINDCSTAFEFLWVAWEMNLLNAQFLCIHKTNELLLYSYNPYTKIAPIPWKLWRTFKGRNDHPWSMFVRLYQRQTDICEGLDFDRTKDLGGYKIRCNVQEDVIFWTINPNKTGVASFDGLEGEGAQLWFRTMNAEANLTLDDVHDPFIYVDENGTTSGVVMDLKDGTSELVLNSYYFEDLANFTITYPHMEGGLGVAAQLSRPMSELKKINSVIDIQSRYGLYFVMMITPVVIKFLLRKPLVSAILDTMRVICNSSIPNVSRSPAARIFLVTLFSFQITILALYTGQLASLLTKPVYGKNVDTMEDLEKLGHTVYAHKSFGHFFTDPIFDGRFVGLEDYECLEYAFSDSTAACVYDWEMLRSYDFNFTIHLSRDMMKKTALANAIQDDWPIEQRFKEIIATTVESGILERLYTKHSEEYASVDKYIRKLRSQSSFEVITLDELSFAFVILGFGLACATVIFIFEIIVG